MTRCSVPLLFLTFVSSLASLDAFIPIQPIVPASSCNNHFRKASVASLNAIDNNPIECYIVNHEEFLEGGKAEVVCTSEPDEYAWFHGLDRNELKPTDGVMEGNMECVQSASPTGITEWECRP